MGDNCSHKPLSENLGQETLVAIAAIENYHTTVASYIKDSLNYTDHLLTAKQFFEVQFNSDLFYYQSAINDNIDLLGISYYDSRPDKLIIDKNPFNNLGYGANSFGENNIFTTDEISMYKQSSYVHSTFHKPLILSEAGHRLLDCGEKYPHIIDVMTLGFTGVAAINIWDGYRFYEPGPGSFVNPSFYDSRNLWSFTIRAQNHYNANDFISTISDGIGTWIQGRQTEKISAQNNDDKAKELQYYLSYNHENAVGYVRNLTFNAYTKGFSHCGLSVDSPLDNLVDVHWQDGNHKLFVEGLNSSLKYKIHWFDYSSGAYIFTSECQNVPGTGRLKLKFPLLTTQPFNERPIVWFVLSPDYSCDNSNRLAESELSFLPEDFWTVYPNPNNGLFTIKCRFNEHCFIYDVMGNLVYQTDLNQGINEINVEFLKIGIYTLTNGIDEFHKISIN